MDNHDLKRAGSEARYQFETGQTVFELESGKHHDHLIGVKSRRIIEFLDEDIEENSKRLHVIMDFKLKIMRSLFMAFVVMMLDNTYNHIIV